MDVNLLKKRYNKVRKVIQSNQFKNGVKNLISKKKYDLLDKLKQIIIELENFEITKQYRNHQLKNSKFYDLHLDGDIILTYKYETDILYVDLHLNDLTNHKDLKKIKDIHDDKKLAVVEILDLNDIYFNENDVAQDYIRHEYLVKRASDGYPIAQFKTLTEAEQYTKKINEGEINMITDNSEQETMKAKADKELEKDKSLFAIIYGITLNGTFVALSLRKAHDDKELETQKQKILSTMIDEAKNKITFYVAYQTQDDGKFVEEKIDEELKEFLGDFRNKYKLSNDDMRQLLSQLYVKKDAVIDDEEKKIPQFIYQFPTLSKEDLEALKDYNLKLLGKTIQTLPMTNGDEKEYVDFVVQGTLKDLKKYCDEYLGYVMHPDYLYRAENYGAEIIKDDAISNTFSNKLAAVDALEKMYKRLIGKFPYEDSRYYQIKLKNDKIIVSLYDEKYNHIGDEFFKFDVSSGKIIETESGEELTSEELFGE